MNDVKIGERQTVQRARHPSLGEGRYVYEHGPSFFVADSGEVEHLGGWISSGSNSDGKSTVSVRRLDGTVLTLDKSGYNCGPRHERVVWTEGNRPGWLSYWFDDFHTLCHVFEPDDGAAPVKFAATQLWVGGEKDKGDPPKSREHLMTIKGPRLTFVYYREKDRAKAEAAVCSPPQRGGSASPRGPMPGPNATRAEVDAWMRSA